MPLRFLGQRIRAGPAPPPDTVLWLNLHAGGCERRLRQCASSLAAALVVLVSFGVLYGGELLRAAQVKVNRQSTPSPS